MVAEPFKKIDLGGGRTAPLYLLRFDKRGGLQSPQAAAAVLELADTASDVFVFSHGWNNVFGVALKRYEEFIEIYARQRDRFGVAPPAGHRPLLVGLIWPSTSFVLPWESGPRIAAAPAPPAEEAARAQEEALAMVTDFLDETTTAEFTELMDAPSLDLSQAGRAAAILASAVAGPDPDNGAGERDGANLLAAWAALAAPAVTEEEGEEEFGTVRGGPATPGDGPEAAGLKFDPRDLLRVGTVWTMKGRAGAVGVNGLAPLLTHLLRAGAPARVHLIGHSFGARVVLSGLAAAAPERKVRSMLLLQAAVNRWCFAPVVARTGARGGYADALDRVELPVLATRSPHDAPLTHAFHLALRDGHLGEPNIAAVGDTELYGALGGYGPAGLGPAATEVPALEPGELGYPLAGPARVVAVDGGTRIGNGPAIGGHGDVTNEVTAWALHRLTSA